MSIEQIESLPISNATLHQFYEKNFAYYSTLNDNLKKLFVYRCLSFIHNKDIITEDYKLVPNKVRALIAASAVQLTLGLKTWSLSYFDTIVIHPDAFSNPLNEQKYYGLTSTGGSIRLSFKSFLGGYSNSKDNINLGLHEFAHALRFNSVKGHEPDYFFEHYYSAWLGSALKAFKDIQASKNTIFREYGGTNMNEFLSVCIEHFFESPHEIRTHYPLLYLNTAILLNQTHENGVTEINIRQKFFDLKNAHYNDSMSFNFSKLKFTKEYLVVLYVLAAFFGITIIEIGFGSMPSLFLAFLFTVTFANVEFSSRQLFIANRKVKVKRGFLFNFLRKELNVSLSHIICLKLDREVSSAKEFDLIFYNPEDDYFYEENFIAEPPEIQRIILEFSKDKIPIFKQ